MGCDHTLSRRGMLDAQMLVAEAARNFEGVSHGPLERELDLVGAEQETFAASGELAA